MSLINFKDSGSDESVEGEVFEDGVKNDRFGRPTIITDKVKEKLVLAYAWGCSNNEASIFAGISERTVDNLFKKDPIFKAYCNELKATPVLMARKKLVMAAMKSPYYALKFLERKLPGEFGQKLKHLFEEPEQLTPEENALIESAIDENI